MTYTIPKHFNHNFIEDFLLKFGEVFLKVDKAEKNIAVDCSNNHKISVIGVMLLYKWMDFSTKKKCFDSPTLFYDQHDEENALLRALEPDDRENNPGKRGNALKEIQQRCEKTIHSARP